MKHNEFNIFSSFLTNSNRPDLALQLSAHYEKAQKEQAKKQAEQVENKYGYWSQYNPIDWLKKEINIRLQDLLSDVPTVRRQQDIEVKYLHDEISNYKDVLRNKPTLTEADKFFEQVEAEIRSKINTLSAQFSLAKVKQDAEEESRKLLSGAQPKIQAPHAKENKQEEEDKLEDEKPSEVSPPKNKVQDEFILLEKRLQEVLTQNQSLEQKNSALEKEKNQKEQENILLKQKNLDLNEQNIGKNNSLTKENEELKAKIIQTEKENVGLHKENDGLKNTILKQETTIHSKNETIVAQKHIIDLLKSHSVPSSPFELVEANDSKTEEELGVGVDLSGISIDTTQ